MNYKFVKLHDSRTGLDYPWILECIDVKTLGEHTKKYMGQQIGNGIKDFFRRYDYHANTNWRSAVEVLGKIKGGISFAEQSMILENQVLNGKTRVLFEYGKLYLRENGSYMTESDTMNVTDTLILDKISWPNYKEEDIKVYKWANGTHYYARIGGMDVVDSDGNQKWDTRKEANEKALEELKNLQ